VHVSTQPDGPQVKVDDPGPVGAKLVQI